MLIVTSGSAYLDIDAYGCCVAYAELLNLLGKPAQAASSAPLNDSIPPSLRALGAPLNMRYHPQPEDAFVIVDLSIPQYFDKIVAQDRVAEIYDHHPGFEQYWQEKLGEASHIEFIGAAATLIYEAWQQAGKLGQMSPMSAKLLGAGILDNTLNFGAKVTTPRDHIAYEALAKHAGLSKQWIADYFSECQASITAGLPQALRNDAKPMKFANTTTEFYVGQVVVWNAQPFLKDELKTIAAVLGQTGKPWFTNLVSISEGRSYFLAEQAEPKEWLHALLQIDFKGNVAQAGRLWLRKEIIKAAQAS